MVPWTIVPGRCVLVDCVRSGGAPEERVARTILEFNCDCFVRAFHQKSGESSMVSREVRRSQPRALIERAGSAQTVQTQDVGGGVVGAYLTSFMLDTGNRERVGF